MLFTRSKTYVAKFRPSQSSTNLIFITFIGCLTNTLLVQVGQFKDLRASLPYILYEIFLEIIGFTFLVVLEVMVSPPFQHF